MSEQRHLLPIYEDINHLKTRKFCTGEEIKFILEQRKDFESAINKKDKDVRDFKKYIEFESIILKQIEIKHDKNNDQDKSTISNMQNRIRRLYQTAIGNFPSDFELCLGYFTFCKQNNFMALAEKATRMMIKNCGFALEVWEVVAAFFAYDLKQTEPALKVVNSGLKLHRDRENLYIEAVKIYLYIANNQANEIEDPEELETAKRRLCLKNLTPYLDMAFDSINNPEFFLKLLELFKETYTKDLQIMVIDKLKDDHYNDETACFRVTKHLRENKKFNEALELINKGLEANKNSKILHEEAIQIHLLNMADEEIPNDEIHQGENPKDCLDKLKHIVDNICNNIDDYEFLIRILKLLEPYGFTKSLQNTLVEKLTSQHSDKEIVWYSLAQSLKNKNDINSALALLQKALSIHKDSQVLITELVQLELSSVTNINKAKSENDENQIAKEKKCENLEKCMKLVLENVKDHNFLINLLEILAPYDFTKNIQDMIVEKLMDCFSHEEIVWHHLAQRERQGLHYSPPYEIGDSLTTQTTLANCIRKYEEGLKRVPSSKRSNLWFLYLDCLIEIQLEDNCISYLTRVNVLKKALEQACKQKFLTEKYFIHWLDLLNDDDEILQVLEKATSFLPNSVLLWKRRLRQAIIKKDESQVKSVFKLGVISLNQKALPLWMMIIGFYCLRSEDHVIEAIYKDGIKQPKEISEALKPRYIEWLALVKGINKARKTYNLLANEEPYCKELHTVMARIESTEIEYNFETWEMSHQLACEQFGEEDIEVWLEYIRFYLYYNRVDNMHEKIQQIFKNAQAKLNSALLSDFRQKFESLLPNS